MCRSRRSQSAVELAQGGCRRRRLVSSGHRPEHARWISTRPSTSTPAYRGCVAKQGEFHTAAARGAHAINARKYAEAEAMPGRDTPYAGISRETVMAIMRLKKEAEL